MNTKAGFCIIKKEHKDLAPKNLILIYSKNPYEDFTKISQKFYPSETFPKKTTNLISHDGVHETVNLGNCLLYTSDAADE